MRNAPHADPSTHSVHDEQGKREASHSGVVSDHEAEKLGLRQAGDVLLQHQHDIHLYRNEQSAFLLDQQMPLITPTRLMETHQAAALKFERRDSSAAFVPL